LDLELCNRGHFYSKQWEALPKLICESGGKTNWIHHFLFSAAIPNVSTGINYLRDFNNNSVLQGCHAFIESFISPSIVLRSLKKWFRLILVSWKLRGIQENFTPKYSDAWLWPMLKKDWFSSIEGTTSIFNCLFFEIFDAALKNIPHQSNGLYIFENQGWERAFLHSWRKHGHGKIIGVAHATVPFWHLYYFDDPRTINNRGKLSLPLPDQIAVNGPMAWEAFLESNYMPAQLAEVEAVRYLNLVKNPQERAKESRQKKSRQSPPKLTKILIVGDMIPLSNHRLLCDLEKAMQNLPNDYSLSFKPHPGLDVNLNNYPNLKVKITLKELENILSSFDLVISANSTSASVDAFLAGIPLIIHMDGSNLNLSPFRGKDGICFVWNVEHLIRAISVISTLETDNHKQEYFWIDPRLPRWNALLNLDE